MIQSISIIKSLKPKQIFLIHFTCITVHVSDI